MPIHAERAGVSQFPIKKFPFDKMEIESKVGKRQIAVDPNQV